MKRSSKIGAVFGGVAPLIAFAITKSPQLLDYMGSVFEDVQVLKQASLEHLIAATLITIPLGMVAGAAGRYIIDRLDKKYFDPLYRINNT